MLGEPFSNIPSGNDDTMEVPRDELDKEIALAKKNLSSKLDQTKKQEDPLARLKNIVTQYKQESRENKEYSPPISPSSTLSLSPPMNLRPAHLPPSSNPVLRPTPPPFKPSPQIPPKRKN
ncbi:MAG: hypothetical protein AABZ60_10725 [Planctomycetota bacterium]